MSINQQWYRSHGLLRRNLDRGKPISDREKKQRNEPLDFESGKEKFIQTLTLTG
jgi:hypothetical protein